MSRSIDKTSPDRVIAYSSERRASMRRQIGSAHYSYVFIEDALVGLMSRAGYQTQVVIQPEIFKTEVAYAQSFKRKSQDIIHIAFRSAENIRPMAGAYNICHVAWEFEVMKDRGLARDSILLNQAHMLKLMDEVWVGCTFSQQVLARYGITNTAVVSAPIVADDLPERILWPDAMDELGTVAAVPLCYAGGLTRDDNAVMAAAQLLPVADIPAIRERSNGLQGRIFLSVLSPGDLRKNLLNIIEGFQIATQGPADLLVVKLAISNADNFRSHGLYDSLTPLCRGQMARQDDRVVFILDYLSDRQMTCLFSIADFYLCASHCEGFNLPLLQAMSFGALPITTRNTAMVDYISDDNAVVIRERRTVSPIENMAGDVAGTTYAIGFASRFDVASAITEALRLPAEAAVRKSQAARRTVLDRYGARHVEAVIAARLGEPMTRPTVPA